MAFNAQEYLQSLEVPTFVTEDGVEYRGKIVTFNTVAEYAERLSDVENLLDSDVREMVPGIVKAIGMSEEVIPHIQALPTGGLIECLADFFGCLRGFKKKSK